MFAFTEVSFGSEGNSVPIVRYTKDPTQSPSGSVADAFNSLVSSDDEEEAPDSNPDEADFLGETSSAFTGLHLEYDDSVYPDTNSDNWLHAAEGSEAGWAGGNASVVSAPRALRPLIVKHRFVTLSWEEPEHHAADITGYEVIYKVEGSKRSVLCEYKFNSANTQKSLVQYITALLMQYHIII